ncbi:MAG: mechanosensitive ion channel [Nitrososphaerota archaeon]
MTPEEYSLMIRIILAVLSIILSIFLGSGLRKIITKNLSKFGQAFASKFAEVLRYFLIILGAVIAFSILSLDIVVLTGVSIGIFIFVLISMRDVFSNYAGEIYLRVRRPFGEGDFIKIGKISGRILSINSQDVEIVSLEGEKIIIPNQFFLKHPVINKSSTIPTSIELKIVFKGLELDKTEETIMEALNEIRPELFEDPRIISINQTDDRIEVDLLLHIVNQRKMKWVVNKLSSEFHKRGVEIEIE